MERKKRLKVNGKRLKKKSLNMRAIYYNLNSEDLSSSAIFL